MGLNMYSAHLYNALCKEKLLSRQWIDMDLVMGWHDEIFVGKPPSRPEDYLKRLTLSMGWSAASYARNRRQTAALPEAKSGPKMMKPIANVSRMFVDRYCNGFRKTGFTEADLQKVLAEGVWINNEEEEEEEGFISMSRSGKAASKKQWENIRRLTAIKLLENLRNTLQSEALELSFDYLALHRVCWRMLRLVKQVCDTRLRNIFGFPYQEKESQLPFVVGYIFMAVTGTDQLGKRVAEKGEIVKSKLLMCAAEAVEGVIEVGAESSGEKILPTEAFRLHLKRKIDWGRRESKEEWKGSRQRTTFIT